MGDCPGDGSGDPRDYDHRSLREQRDDRIDRAMAWIKKKGFKFVRIGQPQEGEYFVDYDADRDFYFLVPDAYYVKEGDNPILKAGFSQIYGSTKMEPLNFDRERRYIIVNKNNKKIHEDS